MLGGGLGGGGLFGQQTTPQGGLGGFGLGRGTGLGGGLGGTSTGGGLFGAKQGAGGLFSSGGTQGGGIGGGLFGQTPQSQAQGTGLFTAGGLGTGPGGLFQSPQAGTLGQQKTFGGLFGQSPSLGGGGGAAAGGLFQQQNQSTPLFKQQTAGTGLGTGGGLFGPGGYGGIPTQGTMVKFEPLKGTDTVIKNGLTQNVNTRLQCISAMPQYELKSLEELRYEDYAAGRKGPQGGGGGLFQPGQQPGGLGVLGGAAGGLGGGAGGGLFGQQQKLGGGLGIGGGGLFNQQQQGLGAGGLFSQQKLGGGGGGGLFSTPTSQNKGLGGGLGGLGAGGGGGLFGQQTSQSGGFFGTQAGGLFNQSAQGQQTGLGGLGGQTQLGGGLLGAKTQLSGLGQMGLGTGLGGGLGGLGGLQTSQAGLGGGGLFNKDLGGGLGTGGLGTGLGLGHAGQLGLSGAMGSSGLGTGLGIGGVGGGLGLGQRPGQIGGLTAPGTGLGLGLGLGGTQLGTGLGVQPGTLGHSNQFNQNSLQLLSAQQVQAQLHQQLENLASSPFGDSPLFRSAISDAAKQQKNKDSSTPVASKATSSPAPHYKLNMRPSARFKPVSLSSPSHHRDKSQLFEGLEGSLSEKGETFVPRRSVKKLVIKPKASQPVPLPDSTTPPHKESVSFVVSDDHSVPDREIPPVDTSGTPTPQKAFPVVPTPTSGGKGHDDSIDSPELILGTSFPLKKPIPLRPQPSQLDSTISELHGRVTETSPLSSSPHRVTRAATSETSPHTIPPRTLTRDPLRVVMHTNEPPRPSGITLTGPGYYTIPPLDEVDELESDGQCIIDGFTIGRQGYGQVHFPGQTDVFGLNLDELVSIGPKEVAVYPDDTNKPPEGQALNKKAIVTLEGNWPICKATREPIKDEERLARMNYVDKLKRSTARIGAVFRDYIPETGACVFEVDHFSKYKLIADDSEDEEGDGGDRKGGGGDGTTKKIKTSQPEKQPSKGLLKTSHASQGVGQVTSQTATSLRLDDEVMSDEEDYEDPAVVGVVNGGEPHPQEMEQYVSTLGLNTHRMQVMKASFFGANGASLHTVPTVPVISKGRAAVVAKPHYPSPTLLKKDAFPSPRPSFNETTTRDRSAMDFTDSFTVPTRVPPPMPLHPTLSSLQAQSSLLMAKHNLHTLIPQEKSFVHEKSRMVADAGLFLGRSFRVGWGPSWTLAHSGTQITSNRSSTSSLQEHQQPLFTPLAAARWGNVSTSENQPLRVVIEKVAVGPFAKPEMKDMAQLYEPYLATQLEYSDVNVREDGTPFCVPQRGNAILHAFADLTRQIQAKDGDSLTHQQIRLILQLAVALWGNLSSECDQDPESYTHQLARRRALSRWLMGASRAVIEREVSSAGDPDYLKALFSLVSGQQLSAACRLAHKHRDHKLALLLAQAANSIFVSRELLRQQLNEWDRLKVHLHIDTERLRLYIILAGMMVWEGYDCHVNVCEELDWKRVLALHLWYTSSPTAPITEVLRDYVQAFQGEDAYAPPPLPPYLENGSTPLGDLESFDTCYHLLCLYCSRDHSLELTLRPSSSTPFQLDYRISWHLWGVLNALEYVHMHPTREAQLHTSFATQLEASGLWQWAIFVLLHLDDPALCKWAVRGVLSRQCSESEELTEREAFVSETLHVPPQWVHEAKALQARYQQCYDLEARNLLCADLWNEAHTVIMDHLVPDAVINAETDELLEMLQQLSDHNRCADIQGWDYAGSVYLDFLHISDKFLGLAQQREEVTNYELEDLYSGLSALAHRIEQVPTRSPKERLCQAEMAKRTATYTKLVASIKGGEVSEGGPSSRDVSRCLGQLPMPSDYTFSEYHPILWSHACELAI